MGTVKTKTTTGDEILPHAASSTGTQMLDNLNKQLE